MAARLNLNHDRDQGREEILQGLLAGRLSSQAAAEALSSVSLSHPDREVGLGHTWEAIFVAARVAPEGQKKLTELLAFMSKLPPPKNEKDKQSMLYGGWIWDDMPTLGWIARDEWDGAASSTLSRRDGGS